MESVSNSALEAARAKLAEAEAKRETLLLRHIANGVNIASRTVEIDEGVVIAYGSMYGNTEQMAEAIAAELSAQGIKNIVMHNVSKSNPSYIIADIFKYRGQSHLQQPDLS